MNFVSLVLHGLGCISVYAEIVLVRLLIAAIVFATIMAGAIMGVIVIRLWTDLAIPGWASSIAGSIAILLVQSIVFGIISVFVLLSLRNAAVVIPRKDAPHYIDSRQKLFDWRSQDSGDRTASGNIGANIRAG